MGRCDIATELESRFSLSEPTPTIGKISYIDANGKVVGEETLTITRQNFYLGDRSIESVPCAVDHLRNINRGTGSHTVRCGALDCSAVFTSNIG